MRTLLSAFFAAVNFVYSAVFGGPMDGTAWDVKVKEDGFLKWGSRHDTLLFTNGRLVVAGEIAKGLPAPLYDAARAAGSATAFAAVLEHPLRGRMEWRGSAEGDRIAGEVLVRMPDGAVKRFRFSGARRDG